MWAIADTLPAWSPAATPGLCNLDKKGTPWPTMGANVLRADMQDSRDVITEQCKGLGECEFTAVRNTLGTPNGADADSRLKLVVAVQCLPRAMFLELEDGAAANLYSNLKCIDGCLTCESETFRRPRDMFNFQLTCPSDGIITEIVDAYYAVEEVAPEFIFKPGAAACENEAIPRAPDIICEVDSKAVRDVISKYCLGRQMCAFNKNDLVQMFPASALPACAGDSIMSISAIVECRRRQMPLAADEYPGNNEFNFLHYEVRRLAAGSSASLASAYHMRVAYQLSTDVLHFATPANFTDLVFGLTNRAVAGPNIVRRLLATFTLPSFGTAGNTHAAYWKFRVDGASWFADGGMLSVMSAGFEEDHCINCNLKTCATAADGYCEFSVHLRGSSKYTAIIYGVSRKESAGSKVSVTWKPPINCYQVLDCESYGADCTKVSHDNMLWQPVGVGALTRLECRIAFNARMVGTKIDAKPFCLKANEFAHDENCWPESAVSTIFGPSCAGTYTVDGAETLGLFRGKRNVAYDSKEYQVSVHDDGVCNFTDASGAANMLRDRVTLLKFDEGPCDAVDSEEDLAEATDAAAGLGLGGAAHVSAAGLHPDGRDLLRRRTRAGRMQIRRRDVRHGSSKGASSKLGLSPGGSGSGAHLGVSTKMRCSGQTGFAGEFGVDGATFKYRVHRDTGVSDAGASAAVEVDKMNLNMRRKGHTGDFHYAFAPATPDTAMEEVIEINDGPAGQGLPATDAYIIRVPLDSSSSNRDATFSTWMRKKNSNILPAGEALFSLTYKDALTAGFTTRSADFGTSSFKLLIMPGGALRFESSVYTWDGPVGIGNDKYECSYFTKTFSAQSSVMPELLDGEWHRVTFAMFGAQHASWKQVKENSALKPYMKFFIDDGMERVDITVEGVSALPIKRDPGGLSGSCNPDKTLDDTGAAGLGAAAAVNVMVDSLSFQFRKDPYWRQVFKTVLVGGAFDAATDTLSNAFDGDLDSVVIYERGISDAESALLGADIPCALGFEGSSFAFFPGLSSTRGEESVTFSQMPQCNDGPHTVRFRYLTDQGNGVSLQVDSGETEVGSVVFTEPTGYEAVKDDWRLTDPLAANDMPDIKLHSNEVLRRRALSRRRLLAMGIDAPPASLGYAAAEPNSVRVDVDAVAEWIGLSLTNQASPPFPPPVASPPPHPPPEWVNLEWQCFMKPVVTATDVAPRRRRHLLGGSEGGLYAPPPPPSQEHLNYLSGLATAGEHDLNLIGTVFTLPSHQEKISHYGCNYKRWHRENEYLQAGWQKFKDWTFNHETGAGYYRVTGDAGSRLLYMLEGAESGAAEGVPMSPSCGYKFPGRIVKYDAPAAMDSKNALSGFKICFASGNNTCFLEKNGTVYNCNEESPIYQLPVVTAEDIAKVTPDFYVKLSRLSLRMKKQNFDEATSRRHLLGEYEEDDYEPIVPETEIVSKEVTAPYMYCRAPHASGTGVTTKEIEFTGMRDNYHSDSFWDYLDTEDASLLDEQFKDWIECEVRDRKWDEFAENNEDMNPNPDARQERDLYGMIAYRQKFFVAALFNKCQGKDQSSEPGSAASCCADGIGGKTCVYINGRPGNHYGFDENTDDTRNDDIDPTFVLLKPQPCEFGYCTEGGGRDVKSPPPPPPFEMPPMPKKPPTPPGKVVNPDYEDDWTPGSPPPPSPPPAAPKGAVYESTSGVCFEQDPNVIKWSKAVNIQAKCSDGKKQVLSGWGMSSCGDYITAAAGLGGDSLDVDDYTGNSTNATDATGMKTMKVCAAIDSLHEMEEGCYEDKTALMKMDGETLATMDNFPAQCKPTYAMQTWFMKADTRPWYVAKAEPGRGHIGFKCCKLPHSRACAERATGCAIPRNGSLFALDDVGVFCDAEADEVMTGWRVASDGCADDKLQIIAECCSAEPPKSIFDIEGLTCTGDANNTFCAGYDASAMEEIPMVTEMVPIS